MAVAPIQFDPETDTSAVPSPCRQICKLDAARQHCIGCLRTRDEIMNWSLMTEDEKRTVWRELLQRRATQPASTP